MIRNKIISVCYKKVVRQWLFMFDPEKVHDQFLFYGKILGSNSLTKKFTSLFFNYSNPNLKQKILGITFENPVGLAAGFDKSAELVNILPDVGFGYAELGSVTGEPCEGNKDRPRLWRLKKSKGLVVYYGLKNDGCEVISKKLKGQKLEIPLWISVAKTNDKSTVELEAGVKDYLKAYKSFIGIADAITVNISCPNAFGGEPFTDPKKLDKLMFEISKVRGKEPVFVKLSPDLSHEQYDEIIEICGKYRVDGFVCGNLTKKRNDYVFENKLPGKGGMSGKIEEAVVNKMIKYLYKKTEGRFVIVGCGGVFTAEDAYKKIKLGASLIQMITGMIYEGPQVVSEINSGLVDLLKKDGYKNVSEAVGVDNKF
jgi:dihydroorotate dehydrogenase